jgi:hypothetical protein
LAFVTFNYDRTVEHFLFTSLKNSYGRSEAECQAALDAIPIIHLHGRLGYLPWQKGEGRAFRPDVNPEMLRIASSGIKIIHEDISDGRDKDYERAKALLQKSEQVLFLGFGFNEANISRLEIPKLPKKVLATGVGLNSQEAAAISKTCGGTVIFHQGDCLQFIREQLAWG